jgi:mannose-6-phosphate isomerase-like protein (cupin superfamily)
MDLTTKRGTLRPHFARLNGASAKRLGHNITLAAIGYSNNMTSHELDELVAAWQAYLETAGNWHAVTEGVTPKESGCGQLYILGNPVGRPNEDYAIADMRELPYSEPHYHPDGYYEFYFVLAGTALVVVAGKERHVKTGDVVIIPPNAAHFSIPDTQFVIAAVNSPAFKPEIYISLHKTSPAVSFDAEQFQRLSAAPK